MDDPRFNKLFTDPKFRHVPKKERKVKIDQRFQSLFKDKKFVSKVSVDKRGRPGNFSTKENYEKFYQMESSSGEDDDDSDSDEYENPKKSPKTEKKPTKSKKDRKQNKIAKKVQDPNVDYARGEAFLTDSSSEEESSDEDDDQGETSLKESEEGFDKWGELDHDADTTEDATKRLAVCNMDWDRVHADDLFLVLSSFCPSGGRLTKVSVFPSDFGKKRLAEEDQLGPEELRRSQSAENDSDNSESEVDESADMERVRKHQINRLKYYYAVAEFNSTSAANKVYTECDGNEYELSGTRFDLRFIPDEMRFEDDPPKEVCGKMPDAEKYKAKYFETSALSKGKVDLTWDEEDPQRLAAMQKAFDEDNDEALKQYIASSSDDDESKEKKIKGKDEISDDDDDEAAAAKYKALLLGGLDTNDKKETEEESEEEEGAMEMTFAADDDTMKADKAKAVDKMTPWEKYLHAKKEKRKKKREANKGAKEEDNVLESGEEMPSDVDLDDPFFKDLKPKKGKSSKKHKKEMIESEPVEKPNNLELLAMDSDDDKQHFDYKEIVKKDSKKKKKKDKKRKGSKQENQDDFEMNLGDNRFADIFKNPKYNVDPSHPSFKKTKSMAAIIEEKQKRIKSHVESIKHLKAKEEANGPKKKVNKLDPSLASLANSVKSKSDRMKRKRKAK